ncbi:hypothetical protein IAE33_004828 [Pseudomonas sp. S60]|uniref:hypothetical protein n=1 Tax=Pseudomonas sp. S60 TaxID=211124 RepID=UPI001911DBC3|nr:hypothetical protein [Pseudomonas sp. S60]MBK5012968.1 hypothetical protein [Pseudomonas sp. S60]
MQHHQYLGIYYGEAKLGDLLKSLNIYEQPILARGETDTYLSKETAGIELTFSDSETLKSPERDYPDGALVLVNIRYYGKQIGQFSIYQGVLPYGIKFGLKKAALLTLLGEPEWKNPQESRLRWIRENHRVHVTLSHNEEVAVVSVGLPL